MKRISLTLAIVLLVCVISVFTLTACNGITIEGDGNWNITADGKADCVELVSAFFADTLKNPNVVVTYKVGNDVYFTENVKGADSTYVTKDGTTVYCYKKGDFYYYATDTQADGSDAEEGIAINRYYYTSDSANTAHYNAETKSLYDQNYCYFLSSIRGLANIPEAGATFAAANVGEEHDSTKEGQTVGTSSATLTFDYTGNDGTMKITAIATDGMVTSITIATTSTADPQANRNITMTLAYGSAVVTLPDTNAWDREGALSNAVDALGLNRGDTLVSGTVIKFSSDSASEALAVLVDNSLVTRIAAGDYYTLQGDLNVVGVDKDAPALYLSTIQYAEGEDAIAMRDEFFAATLAADNVVVTTYNPNGDVFEVETIANGIDRIVSRDNTIYVYKKTVDDGTDYYFVYESDDLKYYIVKDTSTTYDTFSTFYYSLFNMRDDNLEEPEYANTCVIDGNELTLTLLENGIAYGRIVAVKAGELVSTATYYDMIDHGNVGNSMTKTCTFVYGEATLEEPDLTEFDNPADYQVSDEEWEAIFEDKSMLVDGNFTVTYTVIPWRDNKSTQQGTFKVDGNKYAETLGSRTVYYQKTATEADQNGEYAYSYIVNNGDEWIAYPAHYTLEHFDVFVGTRPAPLEEADYDNGDREYLVGDFSYYAEDADEETEVGLFIVWFEYGKLKKIQYDINEVRYKFEFSAYGTTEVTIPDAREADPVNDPTIGGDAETYRIVDDVAAVADPEALIDGLIARGVTFSYKDYEGDEQTYMAKGNVYYSTVYDEHYCDFTAEDSYDYYTKEDEAWQKASIGYEDEICEYSDKEDALLITKESYQSVLCEGMGLGTMYSNLATMDAYKKEELTFLGREAYKYYYAPESSLDLIVTIDKETGVILAWVAQYKVMGFTIPGFGNQLTAFAVGNDVELPNV